MLFSTIGGKEIVNLCDGSRLGIIAESDLIIDERTGRIISLLIPDKKGILNFFSNESSLEIPWEAVKKIGNDMIIIELEDENKKRHTY